MKVGGVGHEGLLLGCKGRKGALGGRGGSRVPSAELGHPVGGGWGERRPRA